MRRVRGLFPLDAERYAIGLSRIRQAGRNTIRTSNFKPWNSTDEIRTDQHQGNF